MCIRSMYKDVSKMLKMNKKERSDYGWMDLDEENPIKKIEYPTKPQKQVEYREDFESIDMTALIAEWNCFKYKMDSFIISKKKKK